MREQSVKVAEYLALARKLNDESSAEDFRTADKLGWELAMWLPDDIYRRMTYAVRHPREGNTILDVVIDCRKLVLGSEAGTLGPNEVAHHFAREPGTLP